MILSDKDDNRVSMGIGNELTRKGSLCIDITESLNKNSIIILDLRRIKILQQHLKDMIDKYEGENNGNTTT